MLPSASLLESRWRTLARSLAEKTALYLTDPLDVFYLTGADVLTSERELAVYVSSERCVLLHYALNPVHVVAHLQYQTYGPPARTAHTITTLLKEDNCTTLTIDEQSLITAEYVAFQDLGTKAITGAKTQMWAQRIHKDAWELKQMTTAATRTALTLEAVRHEMKVGVSEKQVADQLEQAFKMQGIEGSSFPTIVAFGEHTALPHHQPTDRVLQPEQPVLIDCGGKLHHYCSDMTRSWWFGSKPEPLYQTIADLVSTAYIAGEKCFQSPSPPTPAEIDAAVRAVINNGGYGDQFIHTSGHGIGLAIHEPPSLHNAHHEPIKKNTVLTVEPGIYLPGKYGVRYENTLRYDGYQAICLTKPE
jgi:Xaa-Pro aminopeptidase